MKIMLSEIRKTIREELYAMIDEIVSKEVPNGTAWKLSSGKGWAAKNQNGVTNHWYGEDEVANKEKADQFRKDAAMKPVKKTESVDEHVKKRGSGYVVTNKSGSKTLGKHSTKKAADKQLAAIEISKHGGK